MRMLRMDHTRLDAVRPAAPPAGYRLREYTPADWDACVDLMLAAPDPAYTAGSWDRGLCERCMAFGADLNGDYPDGRGQLVFAGDELVAIALCSSAGYLNQVYVLGEHRRRGLARAAVTRVLEALHGQGIERCFLMVFEENGAARQLYASLGFEQVFPPLELWV